MRILVCGGRDYADRETLFSVLDNVLARVGKVEIIAGKATGADALAAGWARARGLDPREFPADWKRYGRKRAGPIRNQQMLDDGKPDAVIAFPGGPGTADMIRRATAAGLPVWKPRRAWRQQA